MNRNYLSANILVKNSYNMVYRVESVDSYNNGADFFSINLVLVACWDYINEDSEIMGWCPANRIVEEYQTDTVTQYFMIESMYEALKENGYDTIENVPDNLRKLVENIR